MDVPEATSVARSGLVLEGRVLPASGQGALTVLEPRLSSTTDCVVRLFDRDAEHRTAMAMLDEGYRFEGLAPGRYWLSARSPTKGNAQAVVEVQGDTRCDLQLEVDATVLVRVRDEVGRPVIDGQLMAVVTDGPPGEWIEGASIWTPQPGGLGVFQADAALPELVGAIGRIVFRRPPPHHVSLLRYQRVLDTTIVRPGDGYADFVLRSDDPRMRTGGIRLRVVDAETREPLTDARVMLDGVGSPNVRCKDGVCEADGMMPGAWRLQVSAKGRGRERLETRVVSGKTTDLGDVALQSARWISGRVVDETGTAEGFNIRFDPCDAQGRLLPWSGGTYRFYRFKEDPSGSFLLEGLGPTFVRVEIVPGTAEGIAESASIFDLREGSVQQALITLVRSVALVVDPDGHHAPDARFEVLDENGMRLAMRIVADPLPVRLLLAPGRYSIEFRTSRGDPEPRTSVFEIVRDPVFVRMR